LPNLTADDLKDLGVSSVGHRRRLLEAIAALRDNATSPQADDDQGSKSEVPPVTAPGLLREDAISHGGERRQLTVMFCDLMGSTALGEKLDPKNCVARCTVIESCAAI
jgi:class 3 adenylate cyclase